MKIDKQRKHEFLPIALNCWFLDFIKNKITMPEQEVPSEIDLSGDGGVLKKMIQEGTGVEKPHDGNNCTKIFI